MAKIVVYDPSDPTVPDRVTQYEFSANTPDYDGEANKLVNPNLSALNNVPVRYWKRSGSTVVEMSQGEKDSIDAVLDSPYVRDVEFASDPTVNDDDTALYGLGSKWVNTVTGTVYYCTDNTTGAAVWGLSGPPSTNIVEAQDEATTTSSSFVAIANMTLTPTSGTYMVWGSVNMKNSAANGLSFLGISVDSVDIVPSNRHMEGTDELPCTTQAKVTVNGSEAIELRFKKSGNGTAYALERSLMIMKV